MGVEWRESEDITLKKWIIKYLNKGCYLLNMKCGLSYYNTFFFIITNQNMNLNKLGKFSFNKGGSLQ